MRIRCQCDYRYTTTSIRLKRLHIFKSLLASSVKFIALLLIYLVGQSFQAWHLSLRLRGRLWLLFLTLNVDTHQRIEFL
jgi:hypothetical protein